MTKTFSTPDQVIDFMNNCGETLDMLHDTTFISYDIRIDMYHAFAEWNGYANIPFTIYIRKHGTFNDWTNGKAETSNLMKYWNKEMVGRFIITKEEETDIYLVTYKNGWTE